MEAMENTKDLCQVCRYYDIGVNQCSKAPKKAIPKSKCADYEYHPHEDLCKYCSHNYYGRCTVQGGKCSVEPFMVNICADFENKGVKDEMGEKQCAEYAHQIACTANAKRIEEIRKRCEEFMHDIVRDFGKLLIIKDTAEISETERKKIDWNKEKQIPYTDKSPFIDFSLKFTVYKKD